MSRKTAALALLSAGLAVAVGYHVLIDATRNWDYNAIRLQRSFVLAAGEPIYSAADSGPILNTLYGPMGAVAYLPVVPMPTPASAVLAGQVISLLFVLVPGALVIFTSAAGRGSRLLAVFGFLLFAALLIDLRPLEYVAFTIHVDAPALGLGLVAWGALLKARPPHETRWFAAASLAAALAVWTKLMLLPLLAAMPAWALLSGGWRRALRLSAFLAVVLGLVSVAMVFAFGPADVLYFNLWTVPAGHTLGSITDPDALARASWRLIVESPLAWALWGLVLVATLARRPAEPFREPAVAYGMLGLALVPFSIFGLLKRGGDVNAFSYTMYPVVIGIVLAMMEEARSSRWIRRLLVGLPAFVLAMVAAFQEPELVETWRRPLATSELPHQIAFEYALEHPGEIYFPRITLASLMAEGRVYHQLVGVLDRNLAGFRPTAEHLRTHLPENLRAVAFYDNGFSAEIRYVDLPGLGSTAERDPELPGFLVYRLQETKRSK